MAGEAGKDPQAWLAANETASAFLSRSLSSRPPITLPPPLHRAPLRPGNVVEIAGPSNSGKSHLLLMAAVQCILPKEWEGIYFGGLGRAVMYLDLDCRFDVLRLAQILRNRIAEGCRLAHLRNGDPENDVTKDEFQCSLQNTLFSDCMQRFLYARCCKSPEFIDALKTVQSQSRREVSGAGIYFVMIDSIGAFYWIDRGSQASRENKGNCPFGIICYNFINCLKVTVEDDEKKIYLYFVERNFLATYGSRRQEPLGKERESSLARKSSHSDTNYWCRKTLQSIFESVVHELRKILQLEPALVLVTKASVYGEGTTTANDFNRDSSKYMLEDPSGLGYSRREEERTLSNREYMPSIWQSFVTHRINLQVEAEVPSVLESEVLPLHTSEWVQPCLKMKEKFSIMDVRFWYSYSFGLLQT
ncbi:hypothetical protein Zm00014a_012384 [Zea mays]|uniref:RecA family profile 1 domain-containing protein n=1 Tax=Zea mays TaxID=4577 RepID=A0A3L6FG71_MAIZE|nr:hypothetical protein Zm00014a_012384 [Zea mays]